MPNGKRTQIGIIDLGVCQDLRARPVQNESSWLPGKWGFQSAHGFVMKSYVLHNLCMVLWWNAFYLKMARSCYSRATLHDKVKNIFIPFLGQYLRADKRKTKNRTLAKQQNGCWWRRLKPINMIWIFKFEPAGNTSQQDKALRLFDSKTNAS